MEGGWTREQPDRCRRRRTRSPCGPASRTAEKLGCAALLLAALAALLAPLPAILAVPLAAGFGAGSLGLARALAGLTNRPATVLCDVVALALFAAGT